MTDDRGRRAELDAFGRPLAGWLRFARYEVRGGMIRPVRGANAEPYDPWEDYRAARSGWGGGGGQVPYESLLELVWSVRLLPRRSGEPVRLETASERALAGWCEAHGLLGILSQETEVAYLAPRWMPMDDFLAAGVALVPVRQSHAWGASGWQRTEDAWWQTRSPALEGAPKQDGALVPTSLQPELWGPPCVLGRSLGEGAWGTLPLGAAWGSFFPDVPSAEQDTYAYPLPLTEGFWQSYGEPVEAFLSAAALFSETVQGLDPEVREGEDALAYVRRRAAADRAYFCLTAGVHPSFEVAADGGYSRAWRAKSLLASFAMMAYLDLTSGKRILACDVCAKPFVSGAYQARYCSARCRNTAMKRSYRGRLRERAVTSPASDRSTEEKKNDEEHNERRCGQSKDRQAG